jgi:hypothetical protein
MWSRNYLPFRSTRVHTLVFSGVRVARSLVFCVVFCHFSFGYCIVCPSSMYSFWLPFWHLVDIVLSVLRCTASDYPFGILWTLYCLFFFDVQLLITPLVSCGHCILWAFSVYSFWLPLLCLVAIVFSGLFRCTASDYPFGYLVAIVFSVLLRCTASDYPFGYLVAIVLSVLLRCTASDYPLGIFKLFLLIYRETRYNVLKYMKRETFYGRLFAKTNVFGNPITNLKVFGTRT